jgi:hypothetical protein
MPCVVKIRVVKILECICQNHVCCEDPSKLKPDKLGRCLAFPPFLVREPQRVHPRAGIVIYELYSACGTVVFGGKALLADSVRHIARLWRVQWTL